MVFVFAMSTSAITEEAPKNSDDAKANLETVEVKDVAEKRQIKKEEEPETVEAFIEKEELTEINGFLNLLHNAEKDKYYLVLDSSELNKGIHIFPIYLERTSSCRSGWRSYW
jgi:CRISPR/Cas system-associated endonuclease Cas3-HD